jgi:GT2 family glycosyltransferase
MSDAAATGVLNRSGQPNTSPARPVHEVSGAADGRSRAACVALIMLTHNQRETTLRALGSFSPAELASAHFLVWDNGSTDATIDAVRERYPCVHIHYSETNLGVASGRNAAAALATRLFRPTHLLFLDNDMVVTPGFIAALLDAFAGEPRLGQAQAKLRSLQEPDRLNDGGGCQIAFWRGRTRPVGFNEIDCGQYDTPRPCISCGGAMMVRADVFEELGGFDARFDPFGPEDLDFSLRLQRRGYLARYIPSAMAYHEVSHTFDGHGRYSAQYARLKAQHWVHFLGRHGTPLQKLGFALAGVPLIVTTMAVRELRKGNPGALLGSARGLVATLLRVRSPGDRDTRSRRP